MSYRPFHPNPTKPDFVVPEHACDAHCHVFGPADKFPFALERKYTPVDAPKEPLFALHKRLVDIKPKEFYLKIAKLIAPYGWHIVVYYESRELADIEGLLMELPTPIAIDHMGRPDVDKGLEHPDYRRIKNLVANRKDTWIKVGCLERMTKLGPPYRDVVPFARDLVESFPDQVLWGTDWPHPNMKSHMPDDGALVNLIPQIAPTSELQRKLLVDNPASLYGFER